MSVSPPRGKFSRVNSFLPATGLLLLVLAAPSQAEEGGFHPVDSLLRAMDLKTDVQPAPDFVQASRPKNEPGYLPVGAQHPQAPLKVKTPAELKAAEASLDAARIRHDQIAGRKPQPKPTAGGATPVAATPLRSTQN